MTANASPAVLAPVDVNVPEVPEAFRLALLDPSLVHVYMLRGLIALQEPRHVD